VYFPRHSVPVPHLALGFCLGVSAVPETGSNRHFCVTGMLVTCGRLYERLVDEGAGKRDMLVFPWAPGERTRAGGMADLDVPAKEPVRWHGAGRAWEVSRVADQGAGLDRAFAPLRTVRQG
jgi:hypothetical protein